MKAIISVDKKAASTGGVNKKEGCIIYFNPAALSDEQREELAMSPERNGALMVNDPDGGFSFLQPGFNGALPAAETADIDVMRQILNARIEARQPVKEKQRQEDIKNMDRFMGLPDEDCLEKSSGGSGIWKIKQETLYIQAAKRLNSRAALIKIERLKNIVIPQKMAQGARPGKEPEGERRVRRSRGQEWLLR